MIETLRTGIPQLLFMLMDKGVEVSVSGNAISYTGERARGTVYLQEKGDAFGARAIELERELLLILAAT